MSVVSVHHVSKHFGDVVAVDDLCLEIPAMTTIALLGPNGAGKTTMMEILQGFTAPTSGAVRVLGEDPRRAGRAWRARTGVVLQSTNLDPQLTVAEVFDLFASVYSSPTATAELLELTGLTEQARVRVAALSGGQRRRVDIALGIVGRPEVLFLDEPTTGLDPEARNATWTVLRELTRSGTTIVMTTHHFEEAEQLADRVVVLVAGRKVVDTTPAGLRTGDAIATVRLAIPARAPVDDFPAGLAEHLNPARTELVVHTCDVVAALDGLVSWARRHDLSLVGLEVGPPTLEEAYLGLTGRGTSVADMER